MIGLEGRDGHAAGRSTASEQGKVIADSRAEVLGQPVERLQGTARLSLSRDSSGPYLSANWIGELLGLGARAARYTELEPAEQLVIALSLPVRDFAAVLIGSGWNLTFPNSPLAEPLSVFRSMTPGTKVRIVTDDFVLVDRFLLLDESRSSPRVKLSGKEWIVSKIRSVAALEVGDEPTERKQVVPAPGALSKMAHLDSHWSDRLCHPSRNLAIVGVQKWLREEADVHVAREDATAGNEALTNLLQPAHTLAATWSTELFSSAGFAEQLPLRDELRCVILDGAAAIRYLWEIEAPIIFALVDRSIADESAADLIMQIRGRGQPMTLASDLEWIPPAGVEAFAFKVRM